MRVADIKRAVAAEFDLPIEVMDEPDGARGSRLRVRARPRQMAMALALEMTRHSSVRVGLFFGGRDHATVLEAKSRINFLLRDDALLRAHTRNILRSLRA